ncbi:hypothetical protein TNCV_1257281 [Trichonephila clavipes]|nr:hypothetical protein TNCV_1257281 [Trichonephila clavipes]
MWRQPGHRYHSVFVVERHTAITQDVTGRGTIFSDTLSSLVVLQRSLMARSYVGEILISVVLLMISCRPGPVYRRNAMVVVGKWSWSRACGQHVTNSGLSAAEDSPCRGADAC